MKQRVNRRRINPKLSFESLEPRHLLAGDLIGQHQVAGSLPTDTNLVNNGDFESLVAGADNFYEENEVDNWLTKGDNGPLNIFNYNGYDNVLDLDSTAAEFDRVYQDIPTVAGQQYLITFDFRGHPETPNGATAQTNDFEVWWGGQLVAIYSGQEFWHTGSLTVTATTTGTTELLFCEVPEDGQPAGGDGVGALLDNIRVVEVTENSVSNGSFEVATGTGVFHTPDQVPSWFAPTGSATQSQLKIAVADENTSATDGLRYLNVDATDSTKDAAHIELDTTAGVSYYLTFDMKIDLRQDGNNDDELRVRWNDAWAGTFHGDTDWQTFGLMVTADSSQTGLTFLEPSTGDGSGPLIDNVRLYTIQQNDISIVASGDATHFPGAGSQPIAHNLSLTHPSADRITSVLITLGDVENGNSEVLAITNSTLPTDDNGDPKIGVLSYRSETRQLQLIGEATAEEYQQVLRSLSYFNSADSVSGTQRTVTIEAFNNDLPVTNASASTQITVNISDDQADIDDAILQKFISDNNLDVQEVSSGLYAVIDEPGTGTNPTTNSTVRVAYTGRFLTLNDQNQIVEGETFDLSSDEGISFGLSQVIDGWTLGIPEFKTGGSGKLLIPSSLGYGPSGTPNGSIPPNTVLVFDVELLEIIA